jgi:serine/threonine-protein kinase
MNGDDLLEPAPVSADTTTSKRASTSPSSPSIRPRITRPSFVITLVEGSPVGEYEVQQQIGEGAMGTVYSAVQPLIGKRVAIKVLKPELCANQTQIERFIKEAQAVNKIGHPNIVDVFSLGELPDGRAYFVMEWLRGEDLKTRLARGPMPVLEACDVLDGIARALDAAHCKDIVHRDLKPDNVFLHKVDDGPVMVKLLDFGIAKLVKRNTTAMDKTNTGDMLGTPRYISPEQARGVNVDHRADIYSLGVMAYEMLAARPPFHGETAMDLVVAHMQEDPPPLSQFARVPKPLEHLVMRMLEKDPDKRPSIADVRAVLIDPTRRNTPASGLRASQIALAVRPPAPRWLLGVAALVGAVAIAMVTWMIAVDRKSAEAASSPAAQAQQGPVAPPVTQPRPQPVIAPPMAQPPAQAQPPIVTAPVPPVVKAPPVVTTAPKPFKTPAKTPKTDDGDELLVPAGMQPHR